MMNNDFDHPFSFLFFFLPHFIVKTTERVLSQAHWNRRIEHAFTKAFLETLEAGGYSGKWLKVIDDGSENQGEREEQT